MNVQVICGSRLGATRQIAQRIAMRLQKAGLDARALTAEEAAGEPPADAFVLGSGVYAGRWQKGIAKFARDQAPMLRQRPVWLFSSGPLGDTATTSDPLEPKEAVELRRLLKARDHRVFAGALDREAVDRSDLNRLERAITRRFIPEGDWRDWGSIEAWADGIAASLRDISVSEPAFPAAAAAGR